MEWYNHVPLATTIARQTDVRWGEHRGIDLVIEDLKARGAKRVAYIGPIGIGKFRKLEAQFTMVEAGREYVRLRLVKSDEEIQWLRIGAALSDLGQTALREEKSSTLQSCGRGRGTAPPHERTVHVIQHLRRRASAFRTLAMR